MSVEIRPLADADLPALSGFLTAGFHTPPDAEFASADVLRWKYLESQGDASEPAPRSLVAVDAGAIVGHVGYVPSTFVGPDMAQPVPTLHMIDWLGSAGHRSVGASLMRRAHETAPVQFGLGGSDAGRAVIKRGGYEPLPPIFVFDRILDPLRWLRVGGSSPRGVARTTRDLARRLINPVRPASVDLTLEPVSTFGPEVAEIVGGGSQSAVVAARTPERLNYLLRYPRLRPMGYLIRDEDRRPRGFAILAAIPRDGGRITLGRIVDLLMDDASPDLWHAALLLLSRELAHLGAHVAQAFASPPWTIEALRRAGYVQRHPLEFQLRDRDRLIPREHPFYLTPIEADYAFT